MTIVLARFALSIAMLLPALAGAASCGIQGKDDTKVAAAGKNYTGVAYIEDCSRLEVVRGPVRICYSDKLLRRVCKPLETGAVFVSETADTAGSSGLAGLFLALPTRKAGGTRSLGPGDLPSGPILLPEHDLTLVLDPGTKLFAVKDLELQTAPGHPDLAKNLFVIPRGTLRPGANYHWSHTGSFGTQTGAFKVITAEEQLAFERTFNEMTQADDPASRALARAIALFEQGFEYDAAAAMAAFE